MPADSDEAGWWSGGAFPGERGAAVIAGHLDSQTGPAVFSRVRELEAGDEVRVIDRHGDSSRFVVHRAEEHRKSAFPTRRVYAETRRPSLRLVTCSGEFDEATGHYAANLVVFARRV